MLETWSNDHADYRRTPHGDHLGTAVPATTRLQPDLPARTLLDGGWWPRSADPAAELPGLILAIEERHGPITRIMLGRAA